MSGVVLQEGDNFSMWKGTKWHCTCSLLRQVIVIADPSDSGFACLKGPANEIVA